MKKISNEDIGEFVKKSQMGFWKLEMEGDTKKLFVDPIMANLTGIEESFTPEESYKFFNDNIDERDYPLIGQSFLDMMTGDSEVIFRYKHPKRGLITVRCTGCIIKKEGNVTTIAGSHRELSSLTRIGKDDNLSNQLVRMNKVLKDEHLKAESFNKSIIEHAACGIVYYTLPLRNDIYMNEEAKRIYGITSKEKAQEKIIHVMNNVVYPDSSSLKELLSLRTRDGKIDYECIVTNQQGKVYNLLSHTEMITNPQGERSVYTTFMDISESKMLKNEKSILEALCRDYAFIYLCDLDNDTSTEIDLNSLQDDKDERFNEIYIKEKLQNEDVSYSDKLKRYYELFVDQRTSYDFLDKLSLENIREKLINNNGKYTCRCRVKSNPFEKEYVEIQIVKLNNVKGFKAVIGFRFIDDIINEERKQKDFLKQMNNRLSEQLHAIGGLSNAYFAVYCLDLKTCSYKAVKNIKFFEDATLDCHTPFEVIARFVDLCVKKEDQDKMHTFTDLKYVVPLLDKTDVIVEEFHGAINPWEWCRACWIAASRDENNCVTSVLFTVEEISASVIERKKREEERKLLEAQHQVINGLSQEYTTVWLISNEGNVCTLYQDTGKDDIARESELFKKKRLSYFNAMEDYARNFVCEEEKDRFINKVSYEHVIKKIREESLYNVVYRRNYKNKQEYFQITFTLADGNKDSNDFVMGLKNVDEVVVLERQKNETLSKALENAKSASEAKTVFLNNMSHDIRTPMNAILGYSRLMKKELTDPKQIRYQEKIEESSNLLLSIINNVLDMSRIESGKMELSETEYQAGSILGEVCNVFETEAEKKHIDFSYSSNLTHKHFMCDITKVKEVLVNLVSNAIKYTPVGGKVTLCTEEIESNKEGYALIKTTVSDNGIGMSKDYIPKIFDSFSRERNTTIGKIAGTGLGMAIVKRFVEMLNGTIEVESELGKGSKFTVIIPHKIIDDAKIDLEEKENKEIDYKEALKGKRILLAEDNDLNAEIAITLLEDKGLIIDRVEDGQLCVNKIIESDENKYDIILMDIQMPNMNGYEAADKIRHLDNKIKASIPIVAMTADAFEEDRKKALLKGMNSHISKPIVIEKLLRIILEEIR